MDTLLIAIMFVVFLVLGLVALAHFARHDTFAGPGTGHRERDELDPLAHVRRAA